MFDPDSRYHALETVVRVDRDGRRIQFVRRRFRPPPAPPSTLGEVTVLRGDRLDLITARVLGNAERFWRIADVNLDIDPFALTGKPGRRIRIPQL